MEAVIDAARLYAKTRFGEQAIAYIAAVDGSRSVAVLSHDYSVLASVDNVTAVATCISESGKTIETVLFGKSAIVAVFSGRREWYCES